MFALGLILALIGAGVFAAVIFGGANDTAVFDVGSVHVALSTAAAFLLGALALLLLLIGLQLIRSGARRAARRRREAKELNRLSAELQAARAQEEAREQEGPRTEARTEEPKHQATPAEPE
jgi:hypothetical protein